MSLSDELVRMLKEELQLLQEPGSSVGEVVKMMGKDKVLVKVHPEGKFLGSIFCLKPFLEMDVFVVMVACYCNGHRYMQENI